MHFARAWALAVSKAGHWRAGRCRHGHALVHHEMQLHIETCAGEGISQAELEGTPEAAENLARPRFVLEAGYSGD
jgi:thiaminase (transcriptional activator TenA)